MILEPRKKRSQQGVCKIPPFVGLGKEDRNNSLHTECRELVLDKIKLRIGSDWRAISVFLLNPLQVREQDAHKTMLNTATMQKKIP